MFPRYLTSMSCASGVTFSLLLFMHLLIASGHVPLEDKGIPVVPPVHFEEPQQKPQETADQVDPPLTVSDRPTYRRRSTPHMTQPMPTHNQHPGFAVKLEPQVGPPEGHAVLLVAVQPIYPQSLLRRGIDGFVLVEFTVTSEGSVADVLVIDSSHRGFERSAIQAAERMKFKPRVLDGKPISVAGVRKQFRFEIES